MKLKTKISRILLLSVFMAVTTNLCSQVISSDTVIQLSKPLKFNYTVSGSLMKRANFTVSIAERYANITILSGSEVIVDNMDIYGNTPMNLNALVNFSSAGDTELSLIAKGQNITISNLSFDDITGLSLPSYTNISAQAGLVDERSLKYGGPSIADIDNDGDYDFVLNNHNDAYSKLFWNNNDGTVTKHNKDLALWNQMDLHGSACGDYDNDGDLDIVISLGGGNGTSPALPVFYKNVNGTFLRSEAEAGITSGARGRAPRWGDFDLDGDLDLALINAQGINGANGAQHIFYSNKGNGTFSLVNVPGLETALCERVLMTDLNNDNIDDFVLFSPLSVWIGNGDFSFTNVTTAWLPATIQGLWGIQAATDVDIDNDGDFDLYLTMGEGYYEVSTNNSVDFDPLTEKLDMRLSGNQGISLFELTAHDSLMIYGYEHVYRSTYNGNFPIFLGSSKTPFDPSIDDTLYITQQSADGWPTERTENGVYIGYVGNGKWNVESHRNSDVYWSISFSIDGAHEYYSAWAPNDRNHNDILLRNDNGKLTDVSAEWNIPLGGNHWGVTTGDFNNDTYQDLFVHRFGFMKSRLSDYMLLNNGNGSFEITTHHNANNMGDRSHGDMGQAFDWDLDGDVDILNGDDEFGTWHLYDNNKADNGNYAIVKVGYSPINNVDPISADIIVKTATDTIHKRVSSRGEVFSQSLLNMVHFGLGNADSVKNITVRWRNGETAEFNNKKANQIFDTDKVDPEVITIVPNTQDCRVGTSVEFGIDLVPVFANRDVIWKSADTTIAKIDSLTGVVTGIKNGESTKIIVKAAANGITDTATINVVSWYAIPAASVTISTDSMELIQGNTVKLSANVLPKYADNTKLTWTSNNNTIITVDSTGFVTTLSAGEAIVYAAISDNNTINDSVVFKVTKFVAPSIAFDDNTKYLSGIFTTGDTMVVSVNYHAGSGNKVVASDVGGVRVWFRHMNKSWGVKKDIIATDATAVGKESGTSVLKIHLKDVVPTNDLTDGDFYYLFTKFASSNGESYNKGIFPIKIGAQEVAVQEELLNDLTIFPNPATNNFTIQGADGAEYTVTVYNSAGYKLLNGCIHGTGTLSIADLSQGFYIVKIRKGAEEHTHKLIKE